MLNINTTENQFDRITSPEKLSIAKTSSRTYYNKTLGDQLSKEKQFDE